MIGFQYRGDRIYFVVMSGRTVDRLESLGWEYGLECIAASQLRIVCFNRVIHPDAKEPNG
jgi:hypothetical protein